MELFTKNQYDLLIQNGRDENPDKDYPPVVKLFMTATACTWLISKLDPEFPDIAFGLCDLGMGYPEMGYVSISEIKELQRGLRFLELDISFQGEYPLSVYAKAASEASYIVTVEAALKNAAVTL